MTTALPSLTQDVHSIHVSCVSPEEASSGVTEFWSGDRLIGVTCIEDGDFTLRIEPGAHGLSLGARALADALAAANRLLQ